MTIQLRTRNECILYLILAWSVC